MSSAACPAGLNPSPDDAVPPPDALLAAVLFLARFLGQPSEAQALAAGLPTAADGRLPVDTLPEVLARAGLSATPLGVAPRKVAPAMLPALLHDGHGRALVVLQRDGDRFECHLPGVQGARWMNVAELQAALPDAHWSAVRPALFFDERSLLYTLPQPRRWFWDVFGRNRWIFHWALLGTLALNVFGALLPFFSMAVYDRVVPNNALDSLWVLGAAALVLVLFELATKTLRGHLVESAAKRMDIALSSAIFSHCLKLRAAQRPASGGVLANVVRDFEAVREFFATGTLALLGDLPFVLLFLVLVGLVGGWLVVVPLVAIPLLLGVSLAVRGPLARHVATSAQANAQRTAHLFETMNGLDTVKALGAEAYSRRKWERLTLAIAQDGVATREFAATAGHVSATLVALTNIALVVLGAVLIGHQQLTMGQLIAVTMLSSRALSPVAQIAGLLVRWQQTRLAFGAIDQVMRAPTDDQQASLQAPPLQGRIEFRDVSFAYPDASPLLDGLNLRIRPGEKVGFIGRLGSGKSTLLKLLLNLYAPQTGTVLVDGVASTQLDALSLRRQLGYVPQDVTLFHGSLRENIELGRSAPGGQGPDAALLEAIRCAGLDETLTQLPKGLATPVGERGERLSGGQRQQVAIARALLTRPPVLLLDEPSSMMDPASEQKLIQRLRGLQDTTVLLVTHRMAMLPLVDRLVVMDRGRVLFDGPRDEVLRALAQTPAAAPVPAPGRMPEEVAA
ncbi:type I secretion system permease/ATPase [Aquabacterium sp. J223]|uniref:type I secretion system permease/ATPase n=1 Tax=Aquabacterium sp. J223 TaxID=2898431 RepID=UPI0021AD7001|nr:type I secretion system permease/ATPase [Aquabacterium sp. J223]UUX95086.1 type I secretion system permease/ATPase [Aquabacterium sp. J223]